MVMANEERDNLKVLPIKENVKLLSHVTELDTSKYVTIEQAANQVRPKVEYMFSYRTFEHESFSYLPLKYKQTSDYEIFLI